MSVQPITSIPISSPGYFGLNTADSPVGMAISFAAVADHCVIDTLGRIGSRKGLQCHTKNPGESYDKWPCERVDEFVDITGVSWCLSGAGGFLFKNDLVTEKATQLKGFGVGQSQYNNNWQIVSLGDRAYLINGFVNPLEFAPGTDPDTVVPMLRSNPEGSTDNPFYPEFAGFPTCATTGFGRLFVSGFTNNQSLIVYSTLEGQTNPVPDPNGRLRWAGTIDVSQYWPNGTDVVTAMAVHNDYLIVFGQHSILVYGDPSGTGNVYEISLQDTISGIGCVSRDTIASLGTDLLFLDASGLRSFGRTLQEKSLPIGNLSSNIKSDIEKAIQESDPADVVGFYNPEDSLYTLTFPMQALTYAFDTKIPLENGTLKTTRWPNRFVRCGFRSVSGKTYYGGTGGLYEYTGNCDITLVDFADGNSGIASNPFSVPVVGQTIDYLTSPATYPIEFRYWTQPQSFGAPSKLKFLKELEITLAGGAGADLWLKWRFNYSNPISRVRLVQEGKDLYYYAQPESEYDDEALYSGGDGLIASKHLKVWGSGRVVAFGFEASIKVNHFSVQELNIQSLLGRTI